jgi:hypothetical protein
MITINLYKKRTPHEILELLRARAGKGSIDNDSWLKYAIWISENGIEANVLAQGEISFINDEDALAFRLKFGI